MTPFSMVRFIGWPNFSLDTIIEILYCWGMLHPKTNFIDDSGSSQGCNSSSELLFISPINQKVNQ